MIQNQLNVLSYGAFDFSYKRVCRFGIFFTCLFSFSAWATTLGEVTTATGIANTLQGVASNNPKATLDKVKKTVQQHNKLQQQRTEQAQAILSESSSSNSKPTTSTNSDSTADTKSDSLKSAQKNSTEKIQKASVGEGSHKESQKPEPVATQASDEKSPKPAVEQASTEVASTKENSAKKNTNPKTTVSPPTENPNPSQEVAKIPDESPTNRVPNRADIFSPPAQQTAPAPVQPTNQPIDSLADLSKEELDERLRDEEIHKEIKPVDYKSSVQIFYKDSACRADDHNCHRGAVLTNIKSVIFDYAHARGSFTRSKK